MRRRHHESFDQSHFLTPSSSPLARNDIRKKSCEKQARAHTIHSAIYQLHRAQATGDGAVITFTTGDRSLSERLVSATRLFDIALSFGSVRSTISLPAAMSHARYSSIAERKVGTAVRSGTVIDRN
jgi:cystathionine beta-lyase/cystathionine gamma-synthase